MKSHHKVSVWLVLFGFVAVLLLLSTSQAAAATRETINLRMAAGHPYSAGTFWVKSVEDFFCREVEKRVTAKTQKYEVKFKSFYGGTLAKLGEVLETVENGLADLGLVVQVFEMSKLEVWNFTYWIPFATKDIDKLIIAHNKTIDHFPIFDENLKNFKQRRVGHAYWSQAPYELITKFPVKTMEDLKGKKLGHGGPMLPWLAALGATSVQASYNDVYTSMDTGVIDGYSMPANVVTAFKIHEVGKYFTQLSLAGANIAGVITINLNKWNKLPKEVQEILVEVGNEFSWDLYKRGVKELNVALDVMKKAGVTVYDLPESERARWDNVLNKARVAAKTIANCKKKGYPADSIADFFVKAMEKEGYKFPSPPNLK
ncbi:MAG: TRAP transporter substrate-binding protein DctP [Deltaproteobacteria bacterium]|nr:TRAP transporter substrate-binding protein DctP [Deltaproteobacteria bacterium]